MSHNHHLIHSLINNSVIHDQTFDNNKNIHLSIVMYKHMLSLEETSPTSLSYFQFQLGLMYLATEQNRNAERAFQTYLNITKPNDNNEFEQEVAIAIVRHNNPNLSKDTLKLLQNIYKNRHNNEIPNFEACIPALDYIIALTYYYLKQYTVALPKLLSHTERLVKNSAQKPEILADHYERLGNICKHKEDYYEAVKYYVLKLEVESQNIHEHFASMSFTAQDIQELLLKISKIQN